LPAAVAVLVEIRVPLSAAPDRRSVEDSFDLSAVADNDGLAVVPDGDRLRLPHAVSECSGGDQVEILMLRQDAARWVNQFEVIGVERLRALDVNWRPILGSIC